MKRIVLSLGFIAGVMAGPVSFLSPSQCAVAAQAIGLEVRARVRDENGAVVETRIPARGTLRSGDEIQVRVSSAEDAYVYVVIYGSTHSASLLYPSIGKDAFVRAGEERIIPGPGSFLPLDTNAGVETIFAISSPTPLDQVSSLLVRMEARGDDLLAVEGVLAERFDAYVRTDFHHAPELALLEPAPVPAPALPNEIVASAEPEDVALVAVVEESIPDPRLEPTSDATVLGGEGSKIEWLLAGGDPDELPTSDGEHFTSAEFFETEATLSPEPKDLDSERPAAAAEESSGVGGTLKSWFGFGKKKPVETTPSAESLRTEAVADSTDAVAVVIPLASAESETAAVARSTEGASVDVADLPETQEPTEPAPLTLGPEQDASAVSSAEPEDSPFSDPQLDGLSDALSLELGLGAGEEEGARVESAGGDEDLLSSLSTWFSSDAEGQQSIATGDAATGSSARLSDPEPQVTVVSGEGLTTVAKAESEGPEPEVMVLASPANGVQTSESVDTAAAEPSVIESEVAAGESGLAPASIPDVESEQAVPSPSGLAQFFGSLFPERRSTTAPHRVDGQSESEGVSPALPAEQGVAGNELEPEAALERPAEPSSARQEPSGLSKFFAGLFSGTANATETVASVPQESSINGQLLAQPETMSRSGNPEDEASESGSEGVLVSPSQALEETEQGNTLDIDSEPGSAQAVEPAPVAQSNAVPVEELEVATEVSSTEVAEPVSVATGDVVPVEELEVAAEVSSTEVAQPVSVAEGDVIPVEAPEPVEKERMAPQDEGSVTGEDERGKKSLWGAIAGFLGKTASEEKAPTGPHVILRGSGAAATPDVVSETAEISTTEDPSITANTLTSGVIDGPQSRAGPLRLKGNREEVLGEADAQVLEDQGRKISTLLGEEPESGPEPEVAEQLEAPAQTLTALPTSSSTGEVTVTAYVPEVPSTLSELPGGRIDLSAVSLASYADTVEIDVTAADGVSRGVVLVVTPTGAGSGALLSEGGHVLTNWHLVEAFPLVSVLLKGAHDAAPSTERVYSARVVKLNKFSDLALLRIEDPPEDLSPLELASDDALERGQIIHAIGHPRAGRWKHTVATIAQVKHDASWRSETDIVHRGTVIRVQVQEDPGATGAPLFNRKLQVIGMSASSGRRPGQLNALALSEIRAFLGEEFRARAESGDQKAIATSPD